MDRLIFLLCAAHFAVDFPLQGDTTAVQKSRHTKNALAAIVPWYYWLFAHAMMHGAGVLLVTGSLALALVEVGAHGLIDFGKCENWYSIHVDQALHLGCKLVYVLLIWKGWGG
jgi:hypothetical protein